MATTTKETDFDLFKICRFGYTLGMPKRNFLRWVAKRNTPEKVYITRVFNYGTFEEWKAMKKKYSRKSIQEAVKNPLLGQWNRRAKIFAEVIFGIQMPDRALIRYDA